MPAFVEPMLAAPAAGPFSHPDWLFELKWDGMRLLAWVRHGSVCLRSRRGRDVTAQFPELALLPQCLVAREAVLDGEAVVLEASGRPEFHRLQRRVHVAKPARALVEQDPVRYYVFDLLYCDGFDLREAPLVERKSLLRALLKPADPVRYSDHVIERGEDLFRLAAEQALEGVVAKRMSSRYQPGRSADWLKIKTAQELDAVVCGYTEPQWPGERFGSLLLGLYEGEHLSFIGACGSGFRQEVREIVWDRLQELASEKPTFAVPAPARVRWVRPELVVRVKYSAWTREGHLREPVFLGLRDDVLPGDCQR